MTTPPSAHLKSRRSRDDVGLELGICGVLLVGAALLFFYNLDGVPLRDWDEGTVARVAQEIAEAPISANRWLSPTLWGDPYWNKPPLVHNLIAWAFRWGGVSTLMARLPSASLATLSVLALYRLGRELFRRRFPAVIAALVYLTSLPIARNGRLAMLDLPSICFALLAWVALLRSRRNWHWSLGVGLGLSAVGLTKGAFLALLMGALMGGFLVWDTPRLLRTGGWLLGLLLGGLPLIAWYGWQSVQYPQVFLSTNLDAQAWQRLFTPVEGNQGWAGFYLVEILKYSWPWLFLIIPGLKLAWQERGQSWGKWVLISGLGYLLAISVMATKLPWYCLPVYPAFAIAVGGYLDEIWQAPRSRHYPLFWRTWLALIALVAVGGMGYAWVTEAPILIAVFAALTFSSLVTIQLLTRKDPQFLSILLWGTYLALLLLMGSTHWLWEINEAFVVEPVAELVRTLPADEPVYIWFFHQRPALNFYSQRPVLPLSARVPSLALQSASAEQIKQQLTSEPGNRQWSDLGNAYLLVPPGVAPVLSSLPCTAIPAELPSTSHWQIVHTEACAY